MENEPTYLGDGLYVLDEGYQLKLFSSNGVSVLQAVYLDESVLASFESYLEQRIAKSKANKMVILEYFNGESWEKVGEFGNERIAWISLGGDDQNYRTIDAFGHILTDKSKE